MKRQTLSEKIAEKQSKKSTPRNARVYAINKTRQVENESQFSGLSNWTRQNVVEEK